MSARGRDHQVVDTDVPVDVIDDIEELQPGDAALIYLAGPGYTPGVYAPVDVIDVIDVLDDVQPGDTALIYLAGPGPCLVAGTVESVMPPDASVPATRSPSPHRSPTTPALPSFRSCPRAPRYLSARTVSTSPAWSAAHDGR